MIGPTHRVGGAHAPQIETALAFTAPGQATWADPTLPRTCSECAHWADLKGQGKNMGRCREYSARMQGRRGQPIKNDSRHAERSSSPRRRRGDEQAQGKRGSKQVKPSLKILKRGAL